jgi:SOS-response transcriptional repressor LexA
MATDFQDNLYQYINEHIANKGVSPSYAEMLLGMGIGSRSKSLITRSLRALNKEGKILLKKTRAKSFNIHYIKTTTVDRLYFSG